jgi:hypothetical protein
MEPRKSLTRKFSTFFGQSKPLASVSEVEIEEGTQKEEHSEAVPQKSDMLSAPIPQRPTRLQRLSFFLPSLNSSKQSKPSQDVLRKPVPARKQPPSQYDAPPPSAPSRLPPAVPTSIFDPTNAPSAPSSELANSTVVSSPNRLQKTNYRTSPEDEALNVQPPTAPLRTTASLFPAVDSIGHGRAASDPISYQPISYQSEGEGSGNEVKKLQRKSWMPGGKTKSTEERTFEAWVNAGKSKIYYDFNHLLDGHQVNFLNPL